MSYASKPLLVTVTATFRSTEVNANRDLGVLLMAKQKAVPAGKQRVIVETGIYKKSNGKYLAQFRDPGRKQNWKEFKTLSRSSKVEGLGDPRSELGRIGEAASEAGLGDVPRPPR